MENKKILIVDDNALNRKVFEHLVGQVYLYETAENGLEGIQKIKTNSFDLIIMDIQMPVMDGIQALKVIKSEKLTQVPIIAISAFANEEDKDYFLSVGFDDFIPKPVNPKYLLESIANHLNIENVKIQQELETKESLVFDDRILRQLLKFNTIENIQMILDEFIDECHSLLEEMWDLIQNEQYEDLGYKIHIIKGNSGTLGANLIYKHSQKMEIDIKKRYYDNVLKDFLYLKSLLNNFEVFIKNQNPFVHE
jgi:two-component system, OmpR family, alkaline phosphatase synthesis response regulator PhoP